MLLEISVFGPQTQQKYFYTKSVDHIHVCAGMHDLASLAQNH